MWGESIGMPEKNITVVIRNNTEQRQTSLTKRKVIKTFERRLERIIPCWFMLWEKNLKPLLISSKRNGFKVSQHFQCFYHFYLSSDYFL